MRRRRESVARGHTTPPVHVVDENPLENHPGLTPLETRKVKRIAKGTKSAKSRVHVEVNVHAE